MINLSIIIPMYNVAPYLEKCIGSVYNQGLNENEFEVILVDDESPDDSLTVAKKLTKDKSNVKIISQKNKGLGGARNTGIKNAKGKYVWFHDPDDLINPKMLQKVMNVATDSLADCIEFGAKGIKGDTIVFEFLPRVIVNLQRGVDYAIKMKTMNSACNKLYLNDFLTKNDLFFIEHIYCEDIEFNSKVYRLASTIDTIQEFVSSFVQTDDSITRNTNSQKQQKMIKDLNFLIHVFTDFRNEESEFDNIQYWENRLTYLNVTLFYQYVKYKKGWNDLKEQKKKLKEQKALFLDCHMEPFSKNIFRLAIKYFL